MGRSSAFRLDWGWASTDMIWTNTNTSSSFILDYVKGFKTNSSGGRFIWGGGGLTRTWLDK